MTVYLGAVVVPDGFYGASAVVHLCECPNGDVLAVHPAGFYRIPAECRATWECVK